MALLGTWIDKTSAQTLGGAAGQSTPFFQTVAHAVASNAGTGGSTNPDTGIVVLRSVQSGFATNAAPVNPFWFGANASIATIGLACLASAAPSVPICAVDVFNLYVLSPIR